MEAQLLIYDDLYKQTSSNSNKLHTLLLLYGGISLYFLQDLYAIYEKSADLNTFLEQTVYTNIVSFAICLITLMYVFLVTSEKFIITQSKYHISNDSVLYLELNDLIQVNKNIYEFNISQKASIYCMLRLISIFIVNILIILSGFGSAFELSGKGSTFNSGVFIFNLILLYGLFLTLINNWMLLNQDKISWKKVLKRDAQEKKKWRKLWEIGLFGEASAIWMCVIISLPVIMNDITPIVPCVIVSSIIVMFFLIWTLF